MKLFRLGIIIAILSFICALLSGIGSTLEQNEAMIQLMWSSQIVNRGDDVTLTVFFVSETSDELEIFRLGLHFDWMAKDNYVGFDMTDNPVIIPSKGTHYFNPMIIHIPEDVSVGNHIYNVTIEGYQGDAAAHARGEATYFYWEEPWTRTPSLQVRDSGDPVNNGGTRPDSQQQDQLIVVGGVILVVAVVVLVMVRMRPRKKKIKHAN